MMINVDWAACWWMQLCSHTRVTTNIIYRWTHRCCAQLHLHKPMQAAWIGIMSLSKLVLAGDNGKEGGYSLGYGSGNESRMLDLLESSIRKLFHVKQSIDHIFMGPWSPHKRVFSFESGSPLCGGRCVERIRVGARIRMGLGTTVLIFVTSFISKFSHWFFYLFLARSQHPLPSTPYCIIQRHIALHFHFIQFFLLIFFLDKI